MLDETVRTFTQNKYVFLKDFLDKENCEELTFQLKKLVDEGKTTKDDQCPLSESIHGAPVFDSLLEQLTPYFEAASGLNLHPTYAYARLYRPGDELKVHTDRPACEISATITLGFDGESWPIFLGDYAKEGSGRRTIIQNGETKWIQNERMFEMIPGDAVLYRGMEKAHWRNVYKEGEWQAQVFLHYVDADSKYADQKYDGRTHLAHHEKNEKEEFLYWFVRDAVPKYACKKLIDAYDKEDYIVSKVGVGNEGTVNKEIRDVKLVPLGVHRGIGATLTGIGLYANSEAWKFDITKSNQVDYLKYDKDGHYKSHVDTFFVKGIEETRKLTVLLFLNDDFEGGRLYLQAGNEKVYPPQEAGTVIIFPSFVLHGVEPVTSGVRRSIVTWLVGPWFK
jgi:hypothetical protein